MSTREIILEAAREMAQAKGYAALSFRDVAARVGIKSASVHYHFPTKGDLAAALAQRYREEARAKLQSLSGVEHNPRRRLREYVSGFRLALEHDNRMCLCGILATEYDHLPEQVRFELALFMEVNVSWLAEVLGEIDPASKPAPRSKLALAIYAAVAGAQLSARSRNDISVFDDAIDGFVSAGLIPLETQRAASQ